MILDLSRPTFKSWGEQTAGDSSLMDESIGPGDMKGGPSFRTMSKQDYLLLYGTAFAIVLVALNVGAIWIPRLAHGLTRET